MCYIFTVSRLYLHTELIHVLVAPVPYTPLTLPTILRVVVSFYCASFIQIYLFLTSVSSMLIPFLLPSIHIDIPTYSSSLIELDYYYLYEFSIKDTVAAQRLDAEVSRQRKRGIRGGL